MNRIHEVCVCAVERMGRQTVAVYMKRYVFPSNPFCRRANNSERVLKQQRKWDNGYENSARNIYYVLCRFIHVHALCIHAYRDPNAESTMKTK